MSRENLEIARALYEEFQAGMERDDPGAWFDSEAVADDYEWVVPTPLDGRTVWRGREGFVEFIPPGRNSSRTGRSRSSAGSMPVRIAWSRSRDSRRLGWEAGCRSS